jgi:lipopolysaccharide transport system permease protein
MASNVGAFVTSKDLLWSWTARIIRARYQQSILGGLWIVIQPAATVIIFSVIFTQFVPIDTGNTPYIVFSYSALVPWMLLANSLTDMTNSIVGNMQLVIKVYFPREVLPIAALLARLADFFIAAGILVLLIIFYDVPIYPIGWLFIPVIIAIQFALILGLGLISSALNVFYRDFDPLLKLGIQLWFYASPIIYPVSLVPPGLRSLYFLNPMAGVLSSYRDVLVEARLPGPYLLYSLIISIVVLIIGYWFFKRVEFLFADII